MVAASGEVEKQHVKRRNSNFALKATVGFILLFSLISGLLFHFYKVELDINEEVLNLQSMAKVEALAGNYEESLGLLQEAITLRPNFAALAQDENMVYHAIRIERMGDELEQTIVSGKESEAEAQLEELRQELKGFKEPVFDRHRERLEELNMKYTILSLTNELSKLGTIEDLGNLLNVANGLIGKEATTLKEQITDRIRTTATAEVNKLLERKRYTAALTITDEALGWVRGDDILMELKQKVKQEQASYALAEEQRIQRAMEEAAAEDYINQTAAVELIEFEKVMNELGDIVVVAHLKNVATRAIFNVSLSYEIVNGEGAVIGSGKIGVTPDYVASGEGMTFSVTLPEEIEYEEELKLEIIEGTWSLE
ncbi:hypothetical protein J40TS1_53060 [Paenibacillus montaniterrae]|uniref:Uncharacterized protein n=1 Tax=Paenibacillus montaniterrae TaxID=429341 RepID=A0A919YWA2_9BACL|nr:hypothetical protein J40TS1_53060 [Paenibacillus montaniterrae]